MATIHSDAQNTHTPLFRDQTPDAPSPCIAIREALRWATRAIARSGSATPRLDAEVLLGYVLLLSRTKLYVHGDEPLDAQPTARYKDLVRRRVAHEPVAYIIGQRAFFDVDLLVDRHVLIPRPETELLVEEALAWGREQRGRVLRVVDVGTGSGAIATVLARHLTRTQVWATDISLAALRVAQRNAGRHDANVHLVCGDLLTPLLGPLDLIVANLPYIARKEIDSLAPDVAEYEPRLALDGGEDGLDLVRRLLPQTTDRLSRPGLLLLEIDHRQAKAVMEMVSLHLPDARATVLYDYAGLERIVRVERQGVER